MKDISFYNHTYTSFESLLTSKGDLNTAIIRRIWFNKLDIYKKIIIDSSYLNIFKNITFADRFTILYNNIPLEYCSVCGKPHIHISKSQHTYKLCNHKFGYNYEAFKKSRDEAENNKKTVLLNLLNDKNIIMSEESFNDRLDSLFNARNNYAFMMKTENFGFYHDLILKTINVIPFDINNTRISERLYLIKNNISEIPKCIYCEDHVYYNNRTVGYSKTCRKHRCLLGKETRKLKNVELFKNSINHEKYEVIEYPEIMNTDLLKIKCRKCGGISEWTINNGKIKNLHEMQLCRNCENPKSCKEESVFEYIKSIYDGEIVHHSGSRKIIPPYELDMYIPERKIAIEFDGIYYHSEFYGGKDKNYHLLKTEMCEKNGIHLIHIFENEWVRNNEIVKSRLKDLFGVYGNVVYARKCNVRRITNSESVIFQNENHIQGGVNSSVNLGLFVENELISVMTFRKPRMNKKYEWELLRFCSKIGYHVIGGAGKLLKYFERNYNPKSLISYADRRWSNGNLYKKLEFELDHTSKPNYWYFKNNNRYKLENRMKFQKFRLKNIIEKFDNNLSEVENMRNNGYDRIFDCGNLVLIKKYN